MKILDIESIRRVLNERGLKEADHQMNFWTNQDHWNSKKPLVVAAGTSSGKTEMMLIWAHIFYLDDRNKGKKSLIVPASKKILRDNFEERLKSFNPSFRYVVISSEIKKITVRKLLNDENIDVVICLPQTLNNNIEFLPRFENFILDEAHEWYFTNNNHTKSNGSIQKILNKISPERQFLLTGTPSDFVARERDFCFYWVPAFELFEKGLISDIKVQIISSTLDIKNSDYQTTWGDLRKNVKFKRTEIEESLISVLEKMMIKIKSPLKETNNRIYTKIASLFNYLEKTIIVCHSQIQADIFGEILSGFKDLKGNILVSHSDNDENSVNFERFQTDDNIKILIVVNRGRIGFNMHNLFNIIDFSYTKNFNLLLQMIGRLFRIHKNFSVFKKEKIFYKVSPPKHVLYFQGIMTFVLCLTRMEYFSKFNGKNSDGMKIPVPGNKRGERKPGDKSENIQKPKTSDIKPILWEDLGIPLDLNIFSNVSKYTIKDEFSTVSYCTMGDLKNSFDDLNVRLNEIEDEFLLLYFNGEKMSDASIADKIGGWVNYNHIKILREKHGLENWTYSSIEENEKKILEIWDDGRFLSNKEIAEEIGLVRKTVDNTLKKYEKKTNPQRKKDKEIEKLKLAYFNGDQLSDVDLSKITGFSKLKCMYIRNSLGLKPWTSINKVKSTDMKYRQEEERIEKEVLRLHSDEKNQFSNTEIAKKLQIGAPKVNKILKDAGRKPWLRVNGKSLKYYKERNNGKIHN